MDKDENSEANSSGLQGAASYYQGTNLTDPDVVADQSGQTAQSSVSDFPLDGPNTAISTKAPLSTAKITSNFDIHEGTNNGSSLANGSTGVLGGGLENDQQ